MAQLFHTNRLERNKLDIIRISEMLILSTTHQPATNCHQPLPTTSILAPLLSSSSVSNGSENDGKKMYKFLFVCIFGVEKKKYASMSIPSSLFVQNIVFCSLPFCSILD